MMNIPALRQKIDELDQRLLALLNERAELSSSVGRWKQAHQEPVFVPEREEALMRNLVGANRGPLSGSGLRAIYREILSSSRACQKAFSVAFVGAPHSVAWHAVRLRFGVSDRTVPVRNVAELFRVLGNSEAEVGLIARSDLLKALSKKSLRNELGDRIFVCGDVRLADVPVTFAAAEPGEASDHEAEDQKNGAGHFTLPAGDDDISYLSIPQGVVNTAFEPSNGSGQSHDEAHGEGANGAVVSLVRQPVAVSGAEDVFLLLSRRPIPAGPDLKTLVYLSCPRDEDTVASLRELLTAAGVTALTWDTLSYGSRPGQMCHQLELEGAVSRQVIEDALRPASRKISWIEHLGFYPETQVYG